MKKITKLSIGIITFIFLIGLVLFPSSVSATLERGVGSYFLGGSNKTTGYDNCNVTTYDMDGQLRLSNHVAAGTALETKSYGRIPYLDPGRYNLKISGCTGGTTSVVGVYRNAAETAMGAYGANFDGFSDVWLPGLVKKHYNRSSSILVTAADPLDGGWLNIMLYDVNGTQTYPVLGLLPTGGTYELDLDTLSSIPNGRYLGNIKSQQVYDKFTSAVVIRNNTDAPRVFAYRGEPGAGYTLYAPTIRKGYYNYNNVIVVSNTESTAANVTITLYPGPQVIYNASLPARATYAVNTADLNIPANDYTAVITSSKKIVAMTNTSNYVDYRSAAYSFSLVPSRYQSLPLIFKNSPSSAPRTTTVKCMNTGSTTGAIRLTVKGGNYEDSPSLGQYRGWEFQIYSSSNFPDGMYAGVAESLSGGQIYCVGTTSVPNNINDTLLQYESNLTNNDTNQVYSSKILTLYDDN